jgi:hypothetical protein
MKNFILFNESPVFDKKVLIVQAPEFLIPGLLKHYGYEKCNELTDQFIIACETIASSVSGNPNNKSFALKRMTRLEVRSLCKLDWWQMN